MNTYQPYTYLIGWSQHDLWYYGARYARGCNPADLWTKYFTSSAYVKEKRNTLGEPDIIQVRNTFDTAEEALAWESRVLKRMQVSESNKWLNQKSTWNGGVPLSDSHKAKISESLKGRKLSQEHIEKVQKSRSGYRPTEETKHKTSKTLSGRTLSEEHKRNLGNVNRGRKRSKETLAKMSAAVKGKRWMHNGVISKMAYELPDSSWQYGRLKSQ